MAVSLSPRVPTYTKTQVGLCQLQACSATIRVAVLNLDAPLHRAFVQLSLAACTNAIQLHFSCCEKPAVSVYAE